MSSVSTYTYLLVGECIIGVIGLSDSPVVSNTSLHGEPGIRILGNYLTFFKWEAGLCNLMNYSLLRNFLNKWSRYVFVSHERSLAQVIRDLKLASSRYSLEVWLRVCCAYDLRSCSSDSFRFSSSFRAFSFFPDTSYQTSYFSFSFFSRAESYTGWIAIFQSLFS